MRPLIPLWLLLAMTYAPASAFAQTPASGVYPLAGIDPTLDYDDLAPLDSIIGDSHYVGLGEAAHGSEGFIEAKARVIRYLVDQKGFRFIEMETSLHGAEQTADYIRTCNGTAKDSLNHIFNVWYSQSAADLFQWLCQFNQAHPNDPVIFKGMDIQYDTLDDLQDLRDFLTVSAPADANGLMTGLSSCFGYGLSVADYKALIVQLDQKTVKISDTDNAGCEAGVTALGNYLNANQVGLVAATSYAQEAKAEIALLSLESYQAQKYAETAGDVNGGMETRDRGMAGMIPRLRDLYASGAKTIIWAHNVHLAMDYRDIQKTPYDYDSMGTDLAAKLGSDYAPIGLTGYQVSYQYPTMQKQIDITTPDPSSVEALLHTQTSSPASIVDLSGDFLTAGQNYFLDIAFGPGYTVPAKQYRGLIFLQVSGPMVPPQ